MFRGSFRVLAGTAALAFMTVACSQSDPGITTAVKSKFAADDTVKAYRIDVDTKDRVVTLSGEVDNAVAKARAVEIARGVEGVRDVVDNTAIVAGVTPPGGLDDKAAATTGEVARDAAAKADDIGDATKDAALTAAVKTKFLADTKVSGLKIDVDTSKGVLTLTGTVPTADERTHAVAIAKETDGVKSVVNKLKVGKS
jgi:hyperosmotically inducible periplasmic protein